MKTITTTIIALAFTLSANAQTANDTISKPIDLRMKSAGQTLEKGSTQMITGTLMTIVGAALIGIGSSQDQKPLLYIGGFTSIVGVGFTFSGFGKIGKAGRQLYK